MSPRPDREILSNVRDILHAFETRPHAALDNKAAQSVGRYFRHWIVTPEREPANKLTQSNQNHPLLLRRPNDRSHSRLFVDR
jgi:hypothetical protein